MRIVRVLSIGLAICAALVLLPWLFKFNGALSGNPNDWAHFGSYVGGTFSSLVAALALIALLITISQQHQQIQSLRQQASKEDLLHGIDRLERDLEKTLDGVTIQINYGDGNKTVSARDVLFMPSATRFQQAIPSEAEVLQMRDGSMSQEIEARLALFEVFGLAAAELNQIRLYVEGLKKLESKSRSNVLSRYYHRKFNMAYARLFHKNLLKEEWKYET
ncbi:MAG: hypothetical protein ABJQ78_04570 [Alloalcanivorax sp.]